MKSAPGKNYIRTHRKRCHLSQRELGFLIGLESGQAVSQHEARKVLPYLHTVMAYQVIFDTAPRELCPELYTEIEELVATRLMQLMDVLGERKPTPVVLHKRKCLRDVLARLEEHNSRV